MPLPLIAGLRFQDHLKTTKAQTNFFSTSPTTFLQLAMLTRACLAVGEASRRQRTTGNASSADLGMDIAGLPSDILVEVMANIATRSSTPLNDIVNLRQSCKLFRDATAAREVGRCMAVQREWRLHWWDKTRFLSVLRRCAASGNPEASYILGLITSGTQIQAENRIGSVY
ncbi:unnamed protein product [Miscanthus lutarioriparius]|uniref:F-box domain-containing protein n=1 Tax=Miscanthus lutarioriparius TaxID=422564 RepID=A0A811Q5S1_9POAL|nr:unnamed protein product [Miscanthus lutarioriparius]